MKFNINITTDDGEIINIIPVDTEERNWDSANAKSDLAYDIYDEIYRAIIRKEQS